MRCTLGRQIVFFLTGMDQKCNLWEIWAIYVNVSENVHGTALCTIQMLSIVNYELWTVEQLQRPVARDNLLIVSKPKPKPSAPSNDQHRPRWSLIWLRRLPANPLRSHPAPPPLVISAPRETGPQSFWPLMGPHHLLRLGLLGPGSWGQATSPLFVQEFKLVLTDNLIASDVSMLCVYMCVRRWAWWKCSDVVSLMSRREMAK